MRRDHRQYHPHEDRQYHPHEDPLVGVLTAEYGERVAPGLIEARVATLCSNSAHSQDRLSAEHLARSEVASLAATGPRCPQRGR